MKVNLSATVKTFFVLITLCVNLPNWVRADDVVDLHEQIRNTSDITKKIVLNNSIGNKLRYAYPDSALIYYTISKNLAARNNDNLLLSGTYCSIGSVWALKNDYDSAIANINKCIEIANLNNDVENLARGYNALGLVQIRNNKNRTATNTLTTALNYTDDISNPKLNSKIYNNLGLAFKRLTIYDSSLFFYHKSLNIKEQIGDEKGIGSTTNNIALMYEKIGDYDLSYKYLTRSLLIRQKNKNKYGEAIVLNNFGLFYERQQEYKEALNYYERSLDVMSALNKKKRMATLYNNIGSTYSKLKNFKQAHFHLEKALELNQELNNKRGQLFSLIDLAHFYQDLRIYINATKYYHKGISLAKSINNNEMIIQNYEGLYTCFEIEKKYDSAFFYHKEFIQIKDSINAASSKRHIEKLEIEYDLLKTEKENQVLLKENQINEVKIKQHYLLGVLLGATLIFLIVLVILIQRNRNRQKMANMQLILQKDEIEKQSTQLKEAFSQLKELSDFKEEMSGMIVHDLKNPINTIINVADLISNNIENAQLIKYSGKHMLNLVMNIMDVSRYEQTGLNLNRKPAEIKYIIQKAYEEVRYNLELKNINLYLTNIFEFVVNIDVGIFERIFINLFTNALKFSPVGGKLEVVYEALPNKKLKIHIKDEGTGIKPELIKSIFEKYGQAERRNLGLTGSTGLGLSFCKLAVEAHNGLIGVDSEVNKGSDFWIIIDYMEQIAVEPLSPTNLSFQTFDFKLLESEKNILREYTDQLKEYEIFEVSEIKKIIKPLESFPISNIKKYYTSLCEAVVSCDEKQYQLIIDEVYC